MSRRSEDVWKLAVLRAALGEARGPRVFARGAELAVDTMLYRLAEPLGLKPGGPARVTWRAHLAGTIGRRIQLRRVLQTLPDGVDVAVLKGEPLARQLYEDPWVRRSGDIDLLVRLEDAGACGRALERAGFVPAHGAQPEPWRYNQWAWGHPETGLLVELHWAIAAPEVPSPPAEELLARRVPIALGEGLEVEALAPAHAFLLVCYHFHHHAGFLKGLVDVAAWLDRFGRWGALEVALERARELGVCGVCQWPLWAISELAGRRVPGADRSAARARAMGKWTARLVEGVLGRAEAIGGGDALAFKIQEVLQLEVTLWRVGMMGLLDRPAEAAAAMGRVLFLSPSQLAQARGSDTTQWRDWVGWARRQAGLGRRLIQDIRQGR